MTWCALAKSPFLRGIKLWYREAMTWEEIANEQKRSCEILLAKRIEQLPRAAISRAYYAVYALLASRAPIFDGFS